MDLPTIESPLSVLDKNLFNIYIYIMIKLPNYSHLMGSLTEFNMIRVQKILHMSQDAVITSIFCFFAGLGIDNLFVGADKEDILTASIKGMIQLIVVIVAVYYIRKLTKFIPFLLRLTKEYNPFHKSKDGEGLVGATIAMGLLLMSTQTNLKKRIKHLVDATNGKDNSIKIPSELTMELDGGDDGDIGGGH
tara:strand:+ start:3181 stop:3753 length:573 start_codon:yes stop_codon:yes gene_type:complete